MCDRGVDRVETEDVPFKVILKFYMKKIKNLTRVHVGVNRKALQYVNEVAVEANVNNVSGIRQWKGIQTGASVEVERVASGVRLRGSIMGYLPAKAQEEWPTFIPFCLLTTDRPSQIQPFHLCCVCDEVVTGRTY